MHKLSHLRRAGENLFIVLCNNFTYPEQDLKIKWTNQSPWGNMYKIQNIRNSQACQKHCNHLVIVARNNTSQIDHPHPIEMSMKSPRDEGRCGSRRQFKEIHPAFRRGVFVCASIDSHEAVLVQFGVQLLVLSIYWEILAFVWIRIRR